MVETIIEFLLVNLYLHHCMHSHELAYADKRSMTIPTTHHASSKQTIITERGAKSL